MITQNVHGFPLSLKQQHDLSWVSNWGQVFYVFDQLISGNLCFGVQSEAGHFFIKYAGAHTLMYPGDPQTAVHKLTQALPIYQDLCHSSFPRMLEAFKTTNGFGVVFQWFEGYPLAPLQVHMTQLRKLSLHQRLRLYDQLLDGLVFAASIDYLPAGISDQHLLVDFSKTVLMLCSVNNFLRHPATVPYPKLPGSPWYVPPEGYSTGKRLDESSLVYTMGMLAFTFFGHRDSQSPLLWEAGDPLYMLATNAIVKDPGKRQQSAHQYLDNWRAEVRNLPFL